MHSMNWIVDIILIMGIVTFFSTVLSYLRVPTIVGFIFSGLLIGHFGIVKDFPGISIINEIGLALLMFTVGLEFSSDKIRHLSKSLLGLGMGMMSVVIAAVTLVGWGLELWEWRKALMIGMIVSLSSSAIVLKVLQKKRELETPHGNASVGVLLAQDILFAPMIMCIPFVFGDLGGVGVGGSGYESLKTLGMFVVYCLSLVAFTRYLLTPLFGLVLKTGSHELFFFLLFFLFALISFGTQALVGSVSLGAFIAGLCFANSPLSKQALSDILPLRDTFLGLLFASVGMLVDLEYFRMHFIQMLLGSVLIVIAKPTVIYLLGRLQRYSHSVSMITALLTFQVGEFSIVLIKELYKRGHFAFEDMQFFLSLTVLTMAMTPFVHRAMPWVVEKTEFLSRFPWRLWKGDRKVGLAQQLAQQKGEGAEVIQELENHTIIVGYGIAGKKLGSVLADLKIPYLALEMNFATVLKAQKASLPVIFGDAQRQEILHVAGIEKARCLVITIPAVNVARTIMISARQLVANISVIIRVEYERGLELLEGHDSMETVVAEHESTLQILAKTLNSYSVDHQTIMMHLNNIKSSWQHPFVRDAVSAFLPYRGSSEQYKQEMEAQDDNRNRHYHTLTATSFAVSRSLRDLHLQDVANIGLVSMKNKARALFVPTPDYVFVAGDTLMFYGDGEEFSKMAQYLDGGHQGSKDHRRF